MKKEFKILEKILSDKVMTQNEGTTVEIDCWTEITFSTENEEKFTLQEDAEKALNEYIEDLSNTPEERAREFYILPCYSKSENNEKLF